MCLVNQHQHVVFVCQFDNSLQVGADAVIRWIVDKYGHCIGVFLDGLLHLRYLHAERYTQSVIDVGVDVDWCCTVYYQCVDYAAVYVAWQYYLLTLLRGSEHHGLYSRGGAADHEEGVCRPECFGSQVFGLFYH